MRGFCVAIVGASLTVGIAGCGSGTPEGTTMPTGTVSMPPEIEQMKADMQKRLLPMSQRYGHKTHRPSSGNRS